MQFRGFEMIDESGRVLAKGDNGADLVKAHIEGYTRRNGSYVRPHDDNRPAAKTQSKAPPSRSKHDEWLDAGKTEVNGFTVHRNPNGMHHVSKNGEKVGEFHYDDGPAEHFVYSGGSQAGTSAFEDMDDIGRVLNRHHGG
ncbi:MAG TPA: hypothetical protein VFM97_00255 [Gammaproteobacteria bacterium]|nr:hypothetical protein [Gammaproteobacteria bacterium]